MGPTRAPTATSTIKSPHGPSGQGSAKSYPVILLIGYNRIQPFKPFSRAFLNGLCVDSKDPEEQ